MVNSILRLLYIIWIINVFFSCNEKKINLPHQDIQTDIHHPILVDSVEIAYNIYKIDQKEYDKAICASIEVINDDNTSYYKLFSTFNSSSIKLENLKTGLLTVVKKDVYYTNDVTKVDMKNIIELFSWQYFLMIQFKLRDPGLNWLTLPNNFYNGVEYNIGQITFDNNTYIDSSSVNKIYIDKKSKLIQYIILSNNENTTSILQSDADKFIIEFNSYKKCSDIYFSRKWQISTIEGNNKKQIREVNVKNVMLIDVFKETFSTENLREINE